jgi:hypothetical protein
MLLSILWNLLVIALLMIGLIADCTLYLVRQLKILNENCARIFSLSFAVALFAYFASSTTLTLFHCGLSSSSSSHPHSILTANLSYTQQVSQTITNTFWPAEPTALISIVGGIRVFLRMILCLLWLFSCLVSVTLWGLQIIMLAPFLSVFVSILSVTCCLQLAATEEARETERPQRRH